MAVLTLRPPKSASIHHKQREGVGRVGVGGGFQLGLLKRSNVFVKKISIFKTL